MKQGGAQARNQGTIRLWHVIVLLVFLLLVGIFSVQVYVSNFRSDAQGEARDLFYDTADYLTACAVEGEKFKPDKEDTNYYYIITARTLAPYHKGTIRGEIIVKLSKDLETIYAATTYTKIFFGTYRLQSTAVFPKDAASVNDLEWSKVQSTLPESGTIE